MLIQMLLNQIFADVNLAISKLALCGKWSSRNKAETFSELLVLKALINSLFKKMHAQSGFISPYQLLICEFYVN